jgi:predicted Fe-Mo cluster-binding NifX family protein
MNTFLRIPLMTSVWILSLALSAMAAGEAVTAVAADGGTADAAVSQQAARAAYFLLFDEQGALVEAVANPYREAAGGAGPQVVAFLAEKGIRTFIAGEFGPRTEAILQGRGIKAMIAAGSAESVVRGMQEL